MIKKVQAGEWEAFDTLVKKYYMSIYHFCYRRFNGDSGTAEDLTQDVFLKLLEHIHTVNPLRKFQNYLYTIAVNTANNYYKKTKPVYMDIENLELIDDKIEPIENLVLKERAEIVIQALSYLPDFQKEVIILRYYHDLKIKDIAKITGASIPTTESRHRQGLEKLRHYLSDFNGGDIDERE